MKPIDIVIKSATEKITKTISFLDRLPTGVTPSSSTGAVIDLLDNSTVSSTLLVSSTGTVSGSSVSFTIQAGTDGHSYQAKLSTTCSDGQVYVDELIIHVRSVL